MANEKLNLKATLAICGVFIGCMSNMIFLELLVKQDSGCGNLVTFLQFFFISIHGFIFTTKCGTKKPNIGLYDYGLLVIMFFLTNVCNNIAFGFNIPVPLHMIFRAGSLVANMFMGIIILGKKYTMSKYLSVAMITLGICISTIVSSGAPKAVCTDCTDDMPNTNTVEEDDYIFRWTIGISLLTLALFVSARMGIYQEWLYGHYGKHPDEALFYTHCMPLAGFGFFYSDIHSHFQTAMQTENLLLPLLNIEVPSQVVYLIGNVLTQYICISSVYILTTECSSLTVTLVITLRKFFSLLFSILYFQNPFTWIHWIGTMLVFGGTAVFTELVDKIRNYVQTKEKVKSS